LNSQVKTSNTQNTPNLFKKIVFFCLIPFWVAIILNSCEKEISNDIPEQESQIVVEGSIENGSPPIIFLSKSFSFFSSLTFNDLINNFISGAKVTITVDDKTIDINEVCYSDLDNFSKSLLLKSLGVENEDSLNTDFDFCVYTPINPDNILELPYLLGEAGKTYQLDIEYEGANLQATTTIPDIVPLDSVYVQVHPKIDTLYRLYAVLDEPATLGNFYRYFTQQNNNPLYPGLSSVFDDLFTNGRQFYFPLDKGQPRSAEFILDTYGYFTINDTITLKFCSIDKPHYDFWRTLEFSADAVGPFSGAVDVAFNIKGEGGIGNWGGYAAYQTQIIAQ